MAVYQSGQPISDSTTAALRTVALHYVSFHRSMYVTDMRNPNNGSRLFRSSNKIVEQKLNALSDKLADVICSGLSQLKNSVSFSSRWHRSARKGPYARRPVSQQSPQRCHRNSASICLVEFRSFSTLEGGMSTASFLHSSFL